MRSARRATCGIVGDDQQGQAAGVERGRAGRGRRRRSASRGCRSARRRAAPSAPCASARAIARRWRSPPESSVGPVVARGARGRPPRARAARAARRSARVDAGEDHRQLDVARRVQARHEVEGLEDEAERARAGAGRARLSAEARDLAALEPVGAGGRPVEAADEVEQRRLAGARGPHDRDVLAGGDGLGDVDQRVHRLVADLEGARQAVELDHGAPDAGASTATRAPASDLRPVDRGDHPLPCREPGGDLGEVPVARARVIVRSRPGGRPRSTSTRSPARIAAVGRRSTPSRRSSTTSTSAEVPGSRLAASAGVVELDLDLDRAVLRLEVEHVGRDARHARREGAGRDASRRSPAPAGPARRRAESTSSIGSDR